LPFACSGFFVPGVGQPATTIAAPGAGRSLPPLLLLFAGSGCAALIYEIVWSQMLELVIGSSAVSLAVVLGTFMGGMGLGNLALPRLVSARRHPLRVYALLELGIGCAALVVLFALPAAGRLYARLPGTGGPDVLWRAAVCAAFLLPPTMLMGATLPAIARWTATAPPGIFRLGACYASNIAGGVAGCLLTGFYLLRVHDLVTATWCAIAINAAVALFALNLAGSAPVTEDEKEPGPVAPAWRRPEGATSVLGSIALSGFCALAAQVIWTRQLALLLGATVYVFSIILAVFLGGLGLGSMAGAAIARRTAQPRRALGWCQLAQVLAIVWAGDLLTRTLPFWFASPPADAGIWARFLSDFLRCSGAILPATCLWGASFPLALAAGAALSPDPGRSVSRVYAANTTGAVSGAILTGLVLLPRFGSAHVEQVLLAGSTLGALLLLRPPTAAGRGLLAAAVCLAVWLGVKSSPPPWQLVAYGRHAAEGDQSAAVLYLGEGVNATIAVTQNRVGTRYFHVSGKTEASSQFHDMRLQRMLGHLPALVHSHPRSVLVVGFGAGVTAGTFVTHPSVERIVICEIEPLIVRAVAPFFEEENHGVLHDPRVEVVFDDARHYLATTREKFDLITSDPIHPWVKGAAKLYSAEYFALCRQHLNPGGLVTQWVPFYQSSREVVRSELATFLSVFPAGTIWSNDEGGHGYDSVLLGSADPLTIDPVAMQQRLDRPDHAAVRESLAEVRLGSSLDLLSTYAGRGLDLHDWLERTEINRDRSLRLQYLAGLSLDSRTGAATYAELLGLRRFPEDLFRTEPAGRAALRRRILPAAAP
jgi:spermidine synthase